MYTTPKKQESTACTVHQALVKLIIIHFMSTTKQVIIQWSIYYQYEHKCQQEKSAEDTFPLPGYPAPCHFVFHLTGSAPKQSLREVLGGNLRLRQVSLFLVWDHQKVSSCKFFFFESDAPSSSALRLIHLFLSEKFNISPHVALCHPASSAYNAAFALWQLGGQPRSWGCSTLLASLEHRANGLSFLTHGSDLYLLVKNSLYLPAEAIFAFRHGIHYATCLSLMATPEHKHLDFLSSNWFESFWGSSCQPRCNKWLSPSRGWLSDRAGCPHGRDHFSGHSNLLPAVKPLAGSNSTDSAGAAGGVSTPGAR